MQHERLRIFAIHAGVSIVVIAAIAAIIYGIWYPGALAALLGVSFIFLPFALVSILIWPMLSALVIKKDKKEQSRDHGILWTIQGIFTAITLYFFWISRVIWIPYTIDLFEIVRKKDIVYTEGFTLQPEHQVGFLDRFQWQGAAFSDDEAHAKIQRNEDLNGVSVAHRIEALRPLADKKTQMQQYAQPLDALLAFNTEMEVAHIRKQYPNATQWLAIKGFVRDAVVLTDADFSFFTIVLLQPWEADL